MPAVLKMKAIKPGRFSGRAATNKLLGATRKAGNDIRKDFEKTTATWSRKVAFEVQYKVRPNGPEVFVFTNNRIYGYVNDGTEPHLIFPVRARALAFPGGPYKAKTTPRVIGSTSGGSSGATVFRAYVQHPGTEARNFDEEIGKLWESKFKRRIEEAMREARQVSGHGL